MEKKSTSRTKAAASGAKKKSAAAKPKKTTAKKVVAAKKTAVPKKAPAVKKPASASKKAAPAKTKKTGRRFADFYAQDKKLADQAARVLDGFNAKDVVTVDLHELSPVTNFFVIATSNSSTHGRGVAERVREEIKANHDGLTPAHVDGLDSDGWIVLDYIGVVVHVFSQSLREHFNLEGLWDGKIKSYGG